MFIEVAPKTTKFIHSTPLLQQTAFWARVKQNHGLSTRAFDIKVKSSEVKEHPDPSGSQCCEQKETDDLLVIIRPVSADLQLAYVPYGPTMKPDEDKRGPYLEELSESLRPYLPGNCILIRYDLAWRSPWIDDHNRYDDRGNWLGNPNPRTREFRMNFDTQEWNLRKAPSDVLPSHTVFLDLKGNEESMLKQMKAKTRYNIRLAYRRGVQVHEVTGESLPVWYDLYRQTTQRNGIISDNLDYFRAVLKTKAEETLSPAKVHLLLAEAEGDALAGMFLATAGGRATYLYGASSNTKRNKMATYALQWEAIKRARQDGCTEYDMFGVAQTPDPSHPMYGLYRFKTGFGGALFHRQGCWDYPLNEEAYEIYRAMEQQGQGYHIN